MAKNGEQRNYKLLWCAVFKFYKLLNENKIKIKKKILFNGLPLQQEFDLFF